MYISTVVSSNAYHMNFCSVVFQFLHDHIGGVQEARMTYCYHFSLFLFPVKNAYIVLCILNRNCQLTPVSLFFIINNIYHYSIVRKLCLLFICHCLLLCKNKTYTHTIKLFFVYKRYDSLTRMLFEIGIPSFNRIMHNCVVTVSRCWHVCSALQ